jgi:hypothetical protein
VLLLLPLVGGGRTWRARQLEDGREAGDVRARVVFAGASCQRAVCRRLFIDDTRGGEPAIRAAAAAMDPDHHPHHQHSHQQQLLQQRQRYGQQQQQQQQQQYPTLDRNVGIQEVNHLLCNAQGKQTQSDLAITTSSSLQPAAGGCLHHPSTII